LRFTPTAIPEVQIIDPQVFEDERGMFMETWHVERFAQAGIQASFVQHNHSGSVRGILRGLHYQIQRPQGKLVRVILGEVFDVAVDLRRSSKTYGKWVGVTLSAARRQLMWIPPGLAHGFFVLSEYADFEYACTDFYVPQDERTLLWNDPSIGIRWPLLPGQPPTLSPKDQRGRPLAEAECYP